MRSDKEPLTQFAGSKKRLIDRYATKFPDNKSTFVDLFAGSFCVSQNATSLYPDVRANDNNAEWVLAIQTLQDNPAGVIDYYEHWAGRYRAAEDPRPFYNDTMRDAYHFEGKSETERSALLILMLQSSFGGMFLRRNRYSGGFGTSFGKRHKSHPTERLWKFYKDIRDISITCNDWEEVQFQGFVFADPPYRSNYGDPVDYNSNIDHEALAEKLKAHGSFAYCGTDLGDGWFDDTFPDYQRVEVNLNHTAKRASVDKVIEVMVYA